MFFMAMVELQDGELLEFHIFILIITILLHIHLFVVCIPQYSVRARGLLLGVKLLFQPQGYEGSSLDCNLCCNAFAHTAISRSHYWK